MPGTDQRPLIGVTGPAKRIAWGRIAACTWLKRMGGHALALSPGMEQQLDEVDALLVTGGSDIDPSMYLTTGGPWVVADPQRDKFELAALASAERRSLPVLGICRGAQLINVAAGGSLHVDITELRRVTSNRPTLRPTKKVDIAPDSQLYRILGKQQISVNSLHHQAVDRVGESLKIVAHDRDNIVQAIEGTGERFCVGVQWHPEYLPWKKTQMKLFKALVRAARD